ncbi:MAG: transporter, partial [Thermodesulfovibrionales bacterium]|nr:transporter [Thermodesulfovibrionales bacterium]
LLFAFMLIHSAVCFAAHPLITDDAGTVGRGKAELELNFEYSNYKEGNMKEEITELSTTLTYGLMENLDLIISIPYQHLKIKDRDETLKEDGISDISLELKWNFYEMKDFASFALKPFLTLPTGDEAKGLGNGKATFGVYLIATKDMEPLALHLNLGYIRNENKVDDRKDIWHISFASELNATKELKLVANIGIERNTDKESNTHPAFILGGFIYSISEKLDIDAGVKFGLNKAEADYAILAGLKYTF